LSPVSRSHFWTRTCGCGDALLGVYDLGALNQGIPDEAYKPLTGDVKAAATEWRKRNKAERDARKQGQFALFEPPREVLEAARALETQAEDALPEVEAKVELFRALIAGPDRYRMEVACDLYVAAFLLPKTQPPTRHTGDLAVFIPTSRDVWDKLAGQQPQEILEQQAVNAAKTARAFHWPLEFPQVFFRGAGKAPGFHLALGNPPWDRIKLSEQEFFSSRDPDIAAAPNAAARRAMIDTLAGAPKGSPKSLLYLAFAVAKRNAEAASAFARTPRELGGRFPLTGTGDINTYALFAELFASCAKMAAIIVPTELATSDTTKAFFAHIVDTGRLRTLYDFQTGKGFFDRIGHARFKFSLVTLGNARNSTDPTFKVAFFLRSQADIQDQRRYFEISRSEITTINPNTRTAPVFRSKADAHLANQIYARVPVLINENAGTNGNPWGIEFATMFHMSNDSGLFRTAEQLSSIGFRRDGSDWTRAIGGGRYVPLYEAKMIHHYDHRWATYERDIGDDSARDTNISEKMDPLFDPAPRYWVPEAEVKDRLASRHWPFRWLMGWRDITNATNERTVIGTAFPLAGVGNNLPVWFTNAKLSTPLVACFIATLSSLVFDFVARFKVGGTHLNFFIAAQLPTLPPSAFNSADLGFVLPRVLQLTYTAQSMKPFADDLGFKGSVPFAWDDAHRARLRAELDARLAKLYGLSRDQLRYILDPADIYGPTHPSETFRGLKKNEIAKYNEYRTARLVLDAWDRMERGELK
jgi:hypothetical protein